MIKYLLFLLVTVTLLLITVSCIHVSTTPDKQRAATPVFEPPGGIYSSFLQVTISCETPGAIIRYTTDGTQPSSSSPVYSSPLNISSNTLLKAKAYLSGRLESKTASAQYITNLDYSWSGNGTINDPYIIADHLDLKELADWVNLGNSFQHDHFRMAESISLTAYRNGQGWQPIGWKSEDDRIYAFSGVFEGNGNTVNDLYIASPDQDCQGLFGIIYGAEISDLAVRGVNITGRNYSGALAGISYHSSLTNCHTTGIVKGNDCVGGLIGSSADSVIKYSSSLGDITGNENTGGLAGTVSHTTLKNSYSKGKVSGNDSYTGGFVGSQAVSLITNCYSRSTVSGGNKYTGGLVGYSYYESIIDYCYSTGSVQGNDLTGGLTGYLAVSSNVRYSYWDTQTSGQSTSAGGFGRTTEEMTSPHAANVYDEWNFLTVWSEDQDHSHNDGYPYLR